MPINESPKRGKSTIPMYLREKEGGFRREKAQEQIVPRSVKKVSFEKRTGGCREFVHETRREITSSIRRTKRGVTTCVLLPTLFFLATHTNIIRRNKLLYALPLVCNSINQVLFEYFFRGRGIVCEIREFWSSEQEQQGAKWGKWVRGWASVGRKYQLKVAKTRVIRIPLLIYGEVTDFYTCKRMFV